MTTKIYGSDKLPVRLDPFQKIVEFQSSGYRWGVIEYAWESGSGKDLDTRTRLDKLDGVVLGYSQDERYQDLFKWGGDTVGTYGKEHILIDLRALRKWMKLTYGPQAKDKSAKFSLKAYWYDEAQESKGNGQIKITYTAHKSGEPFQHFTLHEFFIRNSSRSEEVTQMAQVNTRESTGADDVGDDVGTLEIDFKGIGTLQGGNPSPPDPDDIEEG